MQSEIVSNFVFEHKRIITIITINRAQSTYPIKIDQITYKAKVSKPLCLPPTIATKFTIQQTVSSPN